MRPTPVTKCSRNLNISMLLCMDLGKALLLIYTMFVLFLFLLLFVCLLVVVGVFCCCSSSSLLFLLRPNTVTRSIVAKMQ